MILALALPAMAAPRDVPPPAEAMQAYRTLDKWLRAWDVPETSDLRDPEGTTAASVTLRLAGRVRGRAQAVSDRGDALHTAMLDAWRQADTSLRENADALLSQSLEALAGRFTLDVQIAGRWIPLPGETEEAATMGVLVGRDGVAMRVGERVEAVFPGLMLTTDLTPAKALRVAAGRLDLPPVPLGGLKAERGVTAYAFRVLHIAQPQPGEPGVFLHHAGRLVGSHRVSVPALREAGSNIVAHLEAHTWPRDTPLGLRGRYRPALGDYESMVASPREQGVTAFALARFARAEGLREREADRARSLARRLLRDLAEVIDDEPNPLEDPASAAAILLARSELDRAGGQDEPIDAVDDLAGRALASLGAAYDPATGWRSDTEPPERALIAFALARAGEEERADAAVRTLFRETPPAHLVALMPWLGWAELEIAGGEHAIPSAVALRGMRDMVWEHQIRESDAAHEAPEFAGGIVFTRGSTPYPTWQSMRPLAFLATATADPRLTPPEERGEQLMRLVGGLRFVLQLTIGEEELHMSQSRTLSYGGVRYGLWEQGVGPDPASLALLTLAEAIDAVGR